MTDRDQSAGEGPQSESAREAATRSVGREDLDECWCCGGLHDGVGSLCRTLLEPTTKPTLNNYAEGPQPAAPGVGDDD